MATGRGCQEPDALPAAGRGTRCALLPSAVLCKSDFCGVVTPPCPLEGPLHRRGKPSPACSELRAPSSSSSSPSIRPSPHEPRAGAEAAGGKPLAWGPGADPNGGAWSRRAARASPSPGARFLAAATGSHSNTRKSCGLAWVRGGGCSPPPTSAQGSCLAGWPGRIFACAPRAAEPRAAPRRGAACEHLAGSPRPGICRQGTLSGDGLSEEPLQRGRRRTRPFRWRCCSQSGPRAAREQRASCCLRCRLPGGSAAENTAWLQVASDRAKMGYFAVRSALETSTRRSAQRGLRTSPVRGLPILAHELQP